MYCSRFCKKDSDIISSRACHEVVSLLQDSFIANLLRLIDRMRPSKTAVKEKASASRTPAAGKENVENDVSLKRALYPALALPNNPDTRVCVHCLKCHLLINRLQEGQGSATLLSHPDGNSSLLVSNIRL